MNEIQIFQNGDWQFRTIKQDGNVWFVLKDVCDILGINNPTDVTKRLDNDEVDQIEVIDNLGRNQNTNIINESGLYNVILRSDKPQAKQFKKWVTSEVLPTIRKTGAYLTDSLVENLLANPEAIGKFMLDYARVQKENKSLKGSVERVEKLANRLQPYADFAQTVLSEHGTACIKIIQFAKVINCNGLGPNKLMKLLRDKGILYKVNDYNIPKQYYLNMGYFTCTERTFPVTHRDGRTETKTGITTFITVTGQNWLLKMLRGLGYEVNDRLVVNDKIEVMRYAAD